MISGSDYVLPSDLGQHDHYKIKLSVFSAGSFLNSYTLTRNREYYVKNENLFLRPNELLDREHYVEGNYTLRFDFLERYVEQSLYISEISSTRKEVRLSYYPVASGYDVSEDISNFLNESTDSLAEYTFNSFLELGQGRLIPINQIKDTNNKLPFVYSKSNYIDFVKLKEIIDKSEFKFEEIESFYYFPSNRWDIKTKDGFLIKLPKKNIVNSLKFAELIKTSNKFKNKKIIDLRVSNNIILSNE